MKKIDIEIGSKYVELKHSKHTEQLMKVEVKEIAYPSLKEYTTEFGRTIFIQFQAIPFFRVRFIVTIIHFIVKCVLSIMSTIIGFKAKKWAVSFERLYKSHERFEKIYHDQCFI